MIYFLIIFTISGRSVGFASTFSTVAEGFECIECNPANLGIGPKFSFNILNLDILYYANIPYTKLFYKDYWDESDKEYFRNGEEFDFLFKGQSLSLSFKNFAFSAYIYFSMYSKIPPSVCSLFLWGNEIDKTYKFDGIKLKYQNAVVFTFSYAKLFNPLSIGATVKYLIGLDYRDIDTSSGFLSTTFDYITGEGEIIYKYGKRGKGFAFDLGLLYCSEYYKIGVSIINLINLIQWDKCTIAKYSFKLDTTNLQNFDPHHTLKWQDSTYEISNFNTITHPNVWIGGSITHPTGLSIAGDIGLPLFVGIGVELPLFIANFRLSFSYYKHKLWAGVRTRIKTIPIIDLGIKMSSFSKFSLGITVAYFYK